MWTTMKAFALWNFETLHENRNHSDDIEIGYNASYMYLQEILYDLTEFSRSIIQWKQLWLVIGLLLMAWVNYRLSLSFIIFKDFRPTAWKHPGFQPYTCYPTTPWSVSNISVSVILSYSLFLLCYIHLHLMLLNSSTQYTDVLSKVNHASKDL